MPQPDAQFVGRARELVKDLFPPRWPVLTELWAPVGLRFHALHHLFPGLPYHALPEAHRRLTAGLPADSPYHQTLSPGLLASLRTVWNEASHRLEALPGHV